MGDLDQDGRADLVVGSAGAGISACYGAPAGPAACTLLSSSVGAEGSQSLAVGDVSGTSRPETVVGSPYDGKSEGAVLTLSLSGSRTSTTVARSTLTPDSPGVRGTSEKNDEFGTAVALGDLDGDVRLDLSVGAPDENRGDGALTLLRGSGSSFTTKGARTDTSKDLGHAATRDAGFGEVLGG